MPKQHNNYGFSMKSIATPCRSPVHHDTTTRGMLAHLMDLRQLRYHCTLVKSYSRVLKNRVFSQSLEPSREKGQVAIIST
jgi:hypothetical protein